MTDKVRVWNKKYDKPVLQPVKVAVKGKNKGNRQ